MKIRDLITYGIIFWCSISYIIGFTATQMMAMVAVWVLSVIVSAWILEWD